IGAIYGGDVEHLSLKSTFPFLMDMEAQYGSVIRGMLRRPAPLGAPGGKPPSLFVSLRGGLYDLVQALLDRLGGVTRPPDHKVATVWRPGRGLYAVRLDDGTDWPAEAVVVATPAPVAAEATAALHPFIAQFLREVPYTSAATVSLGFAKRDLAEGL